MADSAVRDLVVSTASGNEAADRAAIFMKEQHFAPALDEHVRPVPASTSTNN